MRIQGCHLSCEILIIGRDKAKRARFLSKRWKQQLDKTYHFQDFYSIDRGWALIISKTTMDSICWRNISWSVHSRQSQSELKKKTDAKFVHYCDTIFSQDRISLGYHFCTDLHFSTSVDGRLLTEVVSAPKASLLFFIKQNIFKRLCCKSLQCFLGDQKSRRPLDDL